MLVCKYGIKKQVALALLTGALTSLQAGGPSAAYAYNTDFTTTQDEYKVNSEYNGLIGLGSDVKSFTNNHVLSMNGTTDGDPVVLTLFFADLSDATITNNGKIITQGAADDYLIGIWDFSSTGTTLSNNGEITSQGFSIYAGSALTINNNENGSINGVLYAPDSAINNSGVINLGISANLFGDTLSSKVSHYTQSATGTLGIKLNLGDDGSVISYSKLYVTNSLSLADGSTIYVYVNGSDTGATAFLSSDATLSDVLKVSEGNINVDISKLNVRDNSALLDFEALFPTVEGSANTSLSLHVIEQAISDVVDNTNPSNSLAAILDVLKNTNTQANQFKNYLTSLPTNEAVTKALNQVKPENTLNTQNVSYQITNAMSQVVQARQSNVRGFSSGDVVFSDKNIWIKPFGGYTSQDDVDGIDGFSANTYGFGMGLDGEYKNGIRAGLAFFYTKADVDTNNVAQSSDLDVFSLVAYGSNPIIDDKTNLFYQLSYGLQKTETTRVVSGVGIGSADYTAKNFFAQLKAMREIQINESLKIRPALVSAYTHFLSPSYSESGLGGLNLDVDKFSSSSFVLGIESDFIYSLDETSKLSASVGLSYDFNNDAQSLTSSFQGGGTVFSTAGIENSAFIYKAGLGYIKKLQDNLFIDMQYDFEGRGNDVQNHVISSKINYKF